MKISITCITPVLQAILDFFPDIISFQHVFHLGVGRSQIEWKLKAKTQISVFPWAKIGQNDHSNPYIESTTVLSDNMGPLSGHCEINITSIACILQDNFDLFIDIISFQHVIHFDVGRIEIEWNMEVKMEILVFA